MDRPIRFAPTIALALCFCVACSADEESARGTRSLGIGPGSGAAASGAGADATGVAGATSADPFGNTSAPPPMLPDVQVDTECKSPTIVFVIDGSGSMCETFGGSTRWGELRAALLDPMRGLIYRLEHRGSFGMLLYDGTFDPLVPNTTTGPPSPVCAGPGALMRNMGECPQLIEVAPSMFNAAAIDAAFPNVELGGSTPTDKAMNYVMDRLIADSAGVDPALNDRYVILATDGQPNDVCVGGVGGDGTAQQRAVVDAVIRGAAVGITTFVISLAGGDPVLEAHLAEVAAQGDPGNPNAVTYNPTDPDSLVATLVTLLGTAFGCDLE